MRMLILRILCCFSIFLSLPQAGAQPIKPMEIALGSSNPITAGSGPIVILADEKSASDRVVQVENGIRIEKLSGKTNTLCGISFKQGATDVFSFSLDLEVLKLPAPRTPGLQGLMVQFVFDDPAPTTTTVGLNCTAKGERGFVFYTGSEPKLTEAQFTGVPFSKGIWLFKREGSQLKFSISESMESGSLPASYREIKRVEIGTKSLKEIQIVCKRRDAAKPASEFMLKSIRFSGDAFYSQPVPKKPFWTAGRVYSALFWICVATVLGYTISRARQIKDWLLSKLG
jgi:hypothetical protein